MNTINYLCQKEFWISALPLIMLAVIIYFDRRNISMLGCNLFTGIKIFLFQKELWISLIPLALMTIYIYTNYDHIAKEACGHNGVYDPEFGIKPYNRTPNDFGIFAWALAGATWTGMLQYALLRILLLPQLKRNYYGIICNIILFFASELLILVLLAVVSVHFWGLGDV